MDMKTAISRAKDKLISSPELNAFLNRVGFVRVIPQLDVSASLEPQPVNEPLPSHIVTFTIEKTPNFGTRLMAEYQGRKYFAA